VARIRSVKPETPERRWKLYDHAPRIGGALLYRLRASDSTLLYVGITQNPIERWRRHAQRKAWWPAVAHIEVEEYPDLRAALAAERAAIKLESPLHNSRSAVA
jgi:predicted GIY-YIG superfamily endonuclease